MNNTGVNEPKSDWDVNRSNTKRNFMKVGGGKVGVDGTWSNRMKERTQIFNKNTMDKLNPLTHFKNILEKLHPRQQKDKNKEIME